MSSCVYFIEDFNSNIKIGYTSNIKVRAASLQTGNAEKYRCIIFVEVDNPKELERDLHKKLAQYRIQGEWFNCDMLPISIELRKLGLLNQLDMI